MFGQTQLEPTENSAGSFLYSLLWSSPTSSPPVNSPGEQMKREAEQHAAQLSGLLRKAQNNLEKANEKLERLDSRVSKITTEMNECLESDEKKLQELIRNISGLPQNFLARGEGNRGYLHAPQEERSTLLDKSYAEVNKLVQEANKVHESLINRHGELKSEKERAVQQRPRLTEAQKRSQELYDSLRKTAQDAATPSLPTPPPPYRPQPFVHIVEGAKGEVVERQEGEETSLS